MWSPKRKDILLLKPAPPALAGTSAVVVFAGRMRACSEKTLARDSYGSNCSNHGQRVFFSLAPPMHALPCAVDIHRYGRGP